MSSPNKRNFDFASEADVKTLYQTAQPWLVKNGVSFEEPFDVIYDTHPSGLPIRKHPESYNAVISAHRLHEVLPEAMASLAIARELEFVYAPACFLQDSQIGTPFFMQSNLLIEMFRAAETDDVAIHIDGPDSPEPWSVSRTYTNRPGSGVLLNSKAEEVSSLWERVKNSWELEKITGENRLTVGEYQALFDIATHLDELTVT